MNDRIGQQLGNYRLVRLLGQGGFADVYLGEHVYLKMQAAIKVLHAQITNDNMTGFVTEAQTIARLHHPHIIRVLDFGLHDNTPFLVMDYAPRGTLRQRHPRGSQLPLPLIVLYVRQIAEALQYAHAQKLIHRDIKPENMLLGSNDEILISDFGIATMAQSSHYQMTQDVVGTVAYMAPEQIQGKPRPVSDEYALGIVIYEWLTGSCPFHGSFTEIASQHVFAQPPPLREKVPTLSSEVEQVLLMALAKDPQQRFINLLAFANAFGQAATQDPTWLAHAPTMPPLAPSAPTITPVFSASQLLTVTPPSPPSGSTVSATPDRSSQAANLAEQVPAGAVPSLQQRFSRRSLFVGVGTVVVVGGSVLAWLAVTQGPFAPSRAANDLRTTATPAATATPSPTPTATPSPTPTPTSPPQPTPTRQPPPTAPPAYLGLYRGPSNMYTAAWSPGAGTWIASAGLGSNIEVWSASTQSPLFYCYGSSTKVYSVVWSPDGGRLASGHSDATVQIWDGTNGGHLLTLTGHARQVNSVAWSPNGQYIASASGDHTVRIWDANTGTLLNTYRGHSAYINTAAWSPDSKYVASGGREGTVQVWDALNGSSPRYTYGGHTDVILAVVWSPNGSRIASCSQDTTVKIWGAFNGTNTLTYNGHSDYVVALGWSPDGRLIASGSKDTTVQIWGAATGSTLHTYHHSDQVEGLTWSPDSTRVASASDDGTVRIWSAE